MSALRYQTGTHAPPRLFRSSVPPHRSGWPSALDPLIAASSLSGERKWPEMTPFG